MASLCASSIIKPVSHGACNPRPSFFFVPLQLQIPYVRFQAQFKNVGIAAHTPSAMNLRKRVIDSRPARIKAVTEDEQTETEGETSTDTSVDQTVSVAVSPSDMLSMFFQAEGTMSDAAIPAVRKALEGVEGVTDLNVKVVEGIASVELTKQTTVQATGVASNLVEVIQGSGFKLQTLNLSFDDEEDVS